jgi:uncharacterized membrane protein
MENYKEKIEAIKSKAEYEFIREMAYKNIVNDTQRHLEAVRQNEIIEKQNRKIQKIRIALIIGLIFGTILLNIIIPDLLAKSLAFGLIFGIVFFIPFTIHLLFKVDDLFWKIFMD